VPASLQQYSENLRDWSRNRHAAWSIEWRTPACAARWITVWKRCLANKVAVIVRRPNRLAQTRKPQTRAESPIAPVLARGRNSCSYCRAHDTPAFGQQRTGDVEADEARRPRHQYRPIRHQVPDTAHSRASLTRSPEHLAIPVDGIARRVTKTIPRRQIQRRSPRSASLAPSKPDPIPFRCRRIVLSSLKILVSAALLYLALRRSIFTELVSRSTCEPGLDRGLPSRQPFCRSHRRLALARVSANAARRSGLTQATRYNLIGVFFKPDPALPIGGDAVRLWAGRARWRRLAGGDLFDLPSTRIGLIALAVVIVASCPGATN